MEKAQRNVVFLILFLLIICIVAYLVNYHRERVIIFLSSLISATPTKKTVEAVDEDVKYRSKPEEICCKTLSTIYGKQFKSHYPDWLKNPKTKRNLELDCHHPSINVAVEYDGVQHNLFPNPFHKTKEEWLKQVDRDRFKREQCEANGVYLITVPWWVKNGEIPKYIYDRLPHRIGNKYAAEVMEDEVPAIES